MLSWHYKRKGDFTMKKTLALVLCAALLAMLFPAFAEEPARKSLTLLVYMTGSDLESDNGAATADIKEMVNAQVDEDRVTVLICTGGAKTWHAGFPNDEVCYYRLEERRPELQDSIGSASMGDPDTLLKFLNYGYEAAPAQDYALILWDHGAGPMNGVCFDELFLLDGDQDRLTLSELRSALEASPFGPERQLAWIGFDACLMAALETALVCAPYAEYMIASQETEPVSGWNYAFLGRLGEVPTGEEAGRLIVDSFMEDSLDKLLLTLSCVRLSEMKSVGAATDALFTAVGRQLTSQTFSDISNERQGAKDFGRVTALSKYDLADLYHLSAQYAGLVPTEAAALQAAIEQAVVCRSGNQPDAHGLSIYSPYSNKEDFANAWLEEYTALGLSDAYARYMARYGGIWLGKALADWRTLSYRALPVTVPGQQTVELTLSEDQLTHFASARVVILRETGEGNSYYNIYEINDVGLEEDRLTADYDYSALYATDAEGSPLTDSYSFQKIDDYYYVHAVLESESYFNLRNLYDLDVERAGFRAREVYLQCRETGEGGELEVVNVISPRDTDGQSAPSRQSAEIDAEMWPYLYFFFKSPLSPARDEDGVLLPATQWPELDSADFRDEDVLDSENHILSAEEWNRDFFVEEGNPRGYRYWGEADNRAGWRLRLMPRQLSGMNLYAQFILTDTQGSEAASELIPLHNPSLLSTQSADNTVFSRDGIDIRLNGVEAVDADMDSGLVFRFDVTNGSDHDAAFVMSSPIVNRSAMEYFVGASRILPAHTATSLYERLPLEKLPPLEDGFIHSLSFIPGVADLSTFPVTQRDIAYGKRFTFEADIDLRALNPRQEWPYPDAALGEGSADGILASVVSLKEDDDGTLRGVLHLVNQSGEERMVYSNSGDTYPHALVNGRYLCNCLTTFSSLALPVDGEAYSEFTLQRVSYNQRFNWRDANGMEDCDMFDYWGIDTVESLGLLLITTHSIQTLGMDGDSYLVDLPLAEPLTLRRAAAGTPGSASLVDYGGMKIDLRGVSLNDDRARLLVDLLPGLDMLWDSGPEAAALHADDPWVVAVDPGSVNGIPCAAEFVLDSRYRPEDTPVTLYNRMGQRALINLYYPVGVTAPTSLEEISLDLFFTTQGYPQVYFTRAEIVPAPGEGGTSFTADQLSVSQSLVGTAEPQ